MKEVKLFYLTHCPYCVKAKKALDELIKENPAYADIRIRWIEESEEAELAGRYDYYYVPTVYQAEEKLYEASPAQDYADIKDSLRSALDRVLAG